MKRRHNFSLAAAALLLGSTAALQAFETQITDDGASQMLARGGDHTISNGIIVWSDNSSGNYDIYMYDTSNGVKTQITADPGFQYDPQIDGDIIVWSDRRSGNYDIYMYDIGSGTETQVTANTARQYSPAVSGNKIVWRDYRSGQSEIYMYDIGSGTTTQITSNGQSKSRPDISGDTIVWSDSSSGNYDIYMYDIGSGTTTKVTTDPSNQFGPHITANTIVWEDYRNGNSDIYMYDIATGTEAQVTSDINNQSLPTVSGSTVYWKDARTSPSSIYAYDIDTGTESLVHTPGDNNYYSLSVEGDTIVWADQRNGNDDVFTYTLTHDEPVTIRNAYDTGDITVTSSCGNLYDVKALTAESLEANASDYPVGLVAFKVACENATVSLRFTGSDLTASSYMKYGPTTPGDADTTAWYAFDDAVLTQNGADDFTWTLTLADNALGDASGNDGIIVDPGGPASGSSISVPLSWPAKAVLAFLTLSAALIGLRRKTA